MTPVSLNFGWSHGIMVWIDGQALEIFRDSMRACHNNAYLLNDSRYPQYPVIKLEDGGFEQENWPLKSEIIREMIDRGELVRYWDASPEIRATSLWNLE